VHETLDYDVNVFLLGFRYNFIREEGRVGARPAQRTDGSGKGALMGALLLCEPRSQARICIAA
jgi:hypothetical protein